MIKQDLPLHQNEFLIDALMKKETPTPGWPREAPQGYWNSSFSHKPTKDEVMELLMKIDAQVVKEEQRRKNQFNRVISGDIMCCLVTISINQEYDKQIVDLIKEIIYVLRHAKFKWYDQPILRAEFYSDKDGKWNPHIHILNKRGLKNGVAPSVIKQALERKLKGEKYQVYRVHACARPLTAGEDYINGVKKTAKLDNVKKDMEYRKKNNIEEIYYLDENHD